MLRLDHGSNLATSARGAGAHAQAGARRTGGRRPRARADRSRLRAHPRDLWLATLPAAARELRHAPAHHPGAAALARYRGQALEASQGALPAADAAALPRARRGYAPELLLHAAEDRLCPRPRERDPGA